MCFYVVQLGRSYASNSRVLPKGHIQHVLILRDVTHLECRSLKALQRDIGQALIASEGSLNNKKTLEHARTYTGHHWTYTWKREQPTPLANQECGVFQTTHVLFG